MPARQVSTKAGFTFGGGGSRLSGSLTGLEGRRTSPKISTRLSTRPPIVILGNRCISNNAPHTINANRPVYFNEYRYRLKKSLRTKKNYPQRNKIFSPGITVIDRADPIKWSVRYSKQKHGVRVARSPCPSGGALRATEPP